MRAFVIAVLAAPLLVGCVSAVTTVVTAPVKAVGQVADWSTTSQDDSARNRGLELRNSQERVGTLSRHRATASETCRDGSDEQSRSTAALNHHTEPEPPQPR